MTGFLANKATKLLFYDKYYCNVFCCTTFFLLIIASLFSKIVKQKYRLYTACFTKFPSEHGCYTILVSTFFLALQILS